MRKLLIPSCRLIKNRALNLIRCIVCKNRRKSILVLLFILIYHGSGATNNLYREIGLEGIMSYDMFKKGVKGYEKIDKSKPIITLIDFTKASVEKRLYVLDLEHKRLLYHTYVAHGRNSGSNYATSFSNQDGSYKSSLGFFLTKGTYQGRNGYSLRLSGLEPGINDRAEARAIVIHGAPYANEEIISRNGRLGRSLGCPALPTSVSREVIDTIKNGSIIFIYSNDENYFRLSSI